MAHKGSKKKNSPKISKKRMVKSYVYGSTLEMTDAVSKPSIKVLPDHQYIILETGEIRSMDRHAKTRADNLMRVKLTMRRLRRLIGANFQGGENELWITLTFKENITDPAIAYKFFALFMQKLNRRFDDLAYIAIIEPQARGAWHYHVLLKSTQHQRLIIPNRLVNELWGQGYTKTQRLKSSDNVSAYVMAYATDLSIDDPDKKSKKKIIKGMRLSMYPKGLRIYRTGGDIVQPKEVTLPKEQVLQEANAIGGPTWTATSKHKLNTGGTVIRHTEYYQRIPDSDPNALIKRELNLNNKKEDVNDELC